MVGIWDVALREVKLAALTLCALPELCRIDNLGMKLVCETIEHWNRHNRGRTM